MHHQVIRKEQIRGRTGHLCVAGWVRRLTMRFGLSMGLTLMLFSVTSVAQAADRFVDNGNGTVEDTNTGLIWLKDASCAELKGTDKEGRANWATAKAAAKALASGTCGLSDGSNAGSWRLPTPAEWKAMVKKGCRPAISSDKGTGCYSEQSSFVGVQSRYYWSSSADGTYLDQPETSSVIAASLRDGTEERRNGEGANRVWPVRSGE